MKLPMRKQAIKKINKKVDELLFGWIRSILSEDEQDKITIENYKQLLPKEEYLQIRKCSYLSMYTKRWTKQNIKKLLKLGYKLNEITIGDLEWMTKKSMKTDQSNIF